MTQKPNKIVRAVKEVARNLNVAAATRKAKEIVDEEAPRPAPEQDRRAEFASLPSSDGGAPGVPCALRLLRGAALLGAGVAMALTLAGCNEKTGTPVPAPATSATCVNEDDPCWDCARDGNRECGPDDPAVKA